MQQNSFFSKYKYIKVLGHGGCGEVFLAENIALGNLWAVKEIAKDHKTSISGYIEPEILKRLNHPALPRICDVYEDETKIYIVEDYIEGICLKHELDKKGSFDELTVIDWGIQLCSVLEYLHSQTPNPIIYGDMKPHNIILTKEGFVKLIDFGISAMVCESGARLPVEQVSRTDVLRCNPMISLNETTYETAFIGTKGYAAPEQFIGNGISKASDIYSLGITLIQLLTGIDPIKAINIIQDEKYSQSLKPAMFELLRKCIHPNPKLRYQTAGLLLKALRQYSLSNAIECENKIIGRTKASPVTKIIAFTGARGTGVSTLTAAMAEYVARGPTIAGIVDMSSFCRLEKSLYGEGLEINSTDTTSPLKINSNLYYINLNYLTEGLHSDTLELQKQLVKLQDSLSYIFIDVDITLVKFIEKYLDHIFIVSDMNPFNSADLGQVLKAESILEKLQSRTSFIINKYYKGELSAQNILQSMLIEPAAPQQLQELIAYSKVFEIPYDQKVYIKWMYSFLGEPLKFKSISTEKFGKKLSKIIEATIIQRRRRHFRWEKD